ncbi:MAG TPA: RluA family pseudouridine synthase [Chlamydiales bacterium]|nr:RluA family pseudouridine synthase [Chlamydiales bacterium]
MQYLVPRSMCVKEALTLIFPDSSRRTLKSWLELGRFSVDGKKLQREDELLNEGVFLVTRDHFSPPKVPGLKILYEDRYLIAIDKPVGLLSVPLDDEGKTERHALGLLRVHLRTDQIFAVHRIDRDVSGVLLFAKGKETTVKMKDLFEEHSLHRQYLAIVEGRIAEDAGVWKVPLLELPNLDVVPSSQGKEAITHFQVIRRSTKYSYLKILLETGKKHQIRVHCQVAGHPVVGDARYGALQNPIRRLGLHAEKLELTHPFTKRKLSLISSPPKAFRSLGV